MSKIRNMYENQQETYTMPVEAKPAAGECRWVRRFGDYHFTSQCGVRQGICIRPKQKICRCGAKIKRFIEKQDGTEAEVTRTTIERGFICYHTDGEV